MINSIIAVQDKLSKSLLSTGLFLGLLFGGGFAHLGSCFGDETTRSKLDSVLSSEVAGEPVNRREVLMKLFGDSSSGVEGGGIGKKSSDDLAIRWQSGFFLLDGVWRSSKDLQEQHESIGLANYEKQRGDGDLDVDMHRRLAKWCVEQGYPEKAKAHWFGVLELNPGDIEARRELGYVYEFGRWISLSEMSLAKSKAKYVGEELKQWMPKVRDWVASMEGADTKKRLRAINQIRELKDPGVILALEVAIGQVSEDTALHLVRAIHRFETREACLSLAGIAIAHPSSSIGSAAIEALRDYPLEFYVPDLLDFMCTEIELKNQVVTRSNGELVLQLVQMREMRDKIERSQLDKIMVVGQKAAGKPFRGLAVELVGGRWMNFQAYRSSKGVVTNGVASSIAESEVQRNADAANANVQRSNESIRKFQSDIATVLRGTTGAKLADDPRSWWDWWDRYAESYGAEDKPIDARYAEDRSSVALAREQVRTVTDYTVLIPRRLDCLVLGTQITTESGPKSIEQIQVGDLVLSQDISTGQLELKPVLRAVRRPAAATKEFELNTGETVRSTLGHPWWIIGKGWTKTKDLQEGMSLRTTTGYASIKLLKDAEDIETFNLVVDGNHTYFVGQSEVLAYDATELLPTFQKVPGVPARVLRAP